MQRNLKRLANESFDLLVIGGGIIGACVARDAALRGLSTALIERRDFAHAASAHNSRLIHGGLRYLRNLEIALIRQSLNERKIWLSIAPDFVRPLRFLLPVSGHSGTRALLGAGLTVYDLLSRASRAPGNPPENLRGHAWLDARATRAIEPCLEDMPLQGAYSYSDAQMDSPERLALACVLDAAECGAVPANHLEAQALLLRGDQVEGARVRDTQSAEIFDIRAHITVATLGPWTDLFLDKALSRPVLRLRRSKGIHLLVRPLTLRHALTVATKAGGHFFAIPWRGQTLLGTTDTAYSGDPDSLSVGQREIDEFLTLVNTHLPAVRLTSSDVKYSYAGLRALLNDGSQGTYNISRRAEVIDLRRLSRLNGLMAVVGGKWTTARHVAQSTVDMALRKLDLPPRPCTTTLRQLSECSAGDIDAQIARAVHEEMAVTLEDLVMRRTNIGQEGDPGLAALDRAATVMAQACGWSQTQKRAEIQSVAAQFRDSPA